MKKIISYILVVAMLLTLVPSVFAADGYDYTMSFDKTAYTAAPGETVSLKLLVTNNIAGKMQTSVGMCQIKNNIPSGLTATVSDSSVNASDVTVGKGIEYVTYEPVTFTDETSLYTINYKIPASATKGTTYTVEFDPNYTFLIDTNENTIDSVETKGATITVEIPEPPAEDYTISFDKTAYTAAPGETVSLKLLVTNNIAGKMQTSVGMCQIKNNIPSGLTATVSDSSVNASDVTVGKGIEYVTYEPVTFTDETSLYTINYKIPASATKGTTYTVEFDPNYTFLIDTNENTIDSVETKGATITVTEGTTDPVYVHSLDVNPDAMYITLSEKANGTANSVKAKIGSAIYKATAEDAGTDVKASVTVSVAGSTATVSFEYEPGKTVSDTIGLTYETSGGGGGGGAAAGFDDKLVVDPEKADDSENKDGKVFDDIETDHFAYEAIEALYEKGIISGDGTNKVRPEYGITREETAKLALAINGIEIEKGASINASDAHRVSDWAKDIVATAANKGILKGYTDGTIRPLDTVTRGEMVAIIIRSLGVNTDDTITNFSDVPQDLWSAKYISAASQLGFVNGYTDGTFKPDQNITRAEAFVIYYRVFKFREALTSAGN